MQAPPGAATSPAEVGAYYLRRWKRREADFPSLRIFRTRPRYYNMSATMLPRSAVTFGVISSPLDNVLAVILFSTVVLLLGLAQSANRFHQMREIPLVPCGGGFSFAAAQWSALPRAQMPRCALSRTQLSELPRRPSRSPNREFLPEAHLIDSADISTIYISGHANNREDPARTGRM
jgi:hypothetical protein